MKLTRDGKVAVLINGQRGWYTQHGRWDLVFDAELAQMVLDGRTADILARLGNHVSSDLVPGLTVEWVREGQLIDIVQHNDREKILVLVRGTHGITGRDLDQKKSWVQV